MKCSFTQNLASRFLSRTIAGCLFLLAMVTEAKAVVITVPSVPGTDTTSLTPFNRRLANSAARFIYTATEIGATGNITAIAFQKASGSTSINVNYVQIYLRETTVSTLSTAAVSYTSTPYVQVYDGYIDNTMTSGWTTVTFNKSPFLFSYSGGSNNLEIVIVKGSETATTSYPIYNCNITTGASTAYYMNATAAFSTSTSFTGTTTRRPNIQLTIDNACSGKPAGGTVTGPSAPVCPATNFTLTGTGVTLASGLHYQWQSRTGSSAFTDMLNDTFSTLTTSITANREYRLMSTCVFSTQYDSTPGFPVTVLAKPSISASSDTTFCAGGSVMLTTSTVGGVTYTWYKDGSPTSTTGGSYTATATGVYTVVASTSSCAGISSATKTVTANPLPAATVTTSGSTTFCDGDSVVLSAGTGTGWTYQWQKGTSDIPGATAANFAAKITGSYRVRVTAATGCYSYSSATSITVNPSPASFTINGAGGATSYCALSSLVLSTTAVSGISYQWRNSSGDISGAGSSSYTVTVPDIYTLVATLGGCSRTSNAVTITENPLPTASITPSGSISFCSGDSLKAQANTGSGLTYEWQESGSAIPGASSSSVYWIKTDGLYTVKVTNTATGCSNVSPSLSVSLISPSKPTVSASSADTFCDGGSVKINAIVASGLTIQWMNGDLIIPGETGTTYTTTASGDYHIRVTNGVGCAAFSNTEYVRVNPNPGNSISLTGSTSEICFGETASLVAATGTGYTYQWQQAGVDIPGATHNPFYATAAGSYAARIIDANGCTDTTAEIAITVKYAAPFFISPDGNTYFCDGGSVTLSTQMGFTDYQWLYNGIDIPGANDTSVLATKNGKYAIRLKDPANGCIATSPGFNILVIPGPDAPVISRAGNRLSANVGTDVSYQWYWNSIEIPGATDSVTIATKVGTYTVEVTNISECSRSSDILITSLGINDPLASAIEVKVFPNPAQDKLNIVAPAGSNVQLSDLQGRTLFQQSGLAPIDMTPYAAGMYMIVITDKDNHTIGVEKISKAAN